MANRKVVVEFLGKDTSLGRTSDQAGKRVNTLGSRMRTVGKIAGGALAGGLIIAGKAAIDAGKAAAEDEAAASKLAHTLRSAAGANDAGVAATERWISAQGKALGVTDDELRPALARLVVATGDVKKAQGLASLAMDVSAGTGKSLEQVSTGLAKAQNGNVGALGRLGIATKNADGSTKSFKQITEELAKVHGGAAAKNADTAAGKQKRLGVAYDELREKIGAKLLPVMQKLTDFGLKAIAWMEKHPGTVKAFGAALMGVAIAFAVAAVAANLIPIAIGLIVGGLIMAYKKFPWFRKGVEVAIKAVGAIFKWLWNNAVQPAMSFIVKAIGWVLQMWGKMLRVLGKVPGFEWAKKAGDKMVTAGKKATELSKNIKKIPDKKNIKITTDTRAAYSAIRSLFRSINNLPFINVRIPKFAKGTNSAPGGLAWVGERGPELVNLPQGSQVIPNRESMRMATPQASIAATGAPATAQNLPPIIVQLVVDGKVLHQSLVKRKRETGMALGLA